MSDLSKLVVVECPRCFNRTQKEVRWLQAHAHWVCERPSCGGRMQGNLNELDKFLKEEAGNFGATYRPKRYPEDLP